MVPEKPDNENDNSSWEYHENVCQISQQREMVHHLG